MSLKQLFTKAKLGNADAQYDLGCRFRVDAKHRHNDGAVERSNELYKNAIKWLRKAAEQGHAKAQYSLSECYRMYTKGHYDAGKGSFWLFAAAKQGLLDAQFDVYYG